MQNRQRLDLSEATRAPSVELVQLETHDRRVREALEQALEHLSQPEVIAARAWLKSQINKPSKSAFQISITPAKAYALLESNQGNRTIRRNRLMDLADSISAGHWMLTGETIIVSREGLLNEGQHRLLGALLAGKPIETFILFGAPREAMRVTGTGAARSPGDMLRIVGGVSGNKAAATIAWIMKMERGIPENLSIRINHETIYQEWLKRREDLEHSMTITDRVYRQLNKPASASLLAAAHYMFSRHDPSAADDFFDRVRSGIGIDSEGSPVGQLRNMLMQNAIRTSRARDRYVHVIALACTVKAWNAWRRGESIAVLRWFGFAANKPESFPEIAD